MNSRETWLGPACSPWAMEGRIGSTRPMPMKATTAANAVAQTDIGWRRMLPPLCADMGVNSFSGGAGTGAGPSDRAVFCGGSRGAAGGGNGGRGSDVAELGE
ncbi:hypothetical protein, partial [Streptosporangium canum]|uniref:hypothetical protein n=1 Tax=Streptosporangium canum TaxID=324952 RepID=UPI003F4DB02A